MKSLLKNIIKIFLKIIFLVFSNNSLNFWKHYKNTLYSHWIKNAFKSSGKGFYCKAPIYLKGGKYISIGNNFSTEVGLRIEAWDVFNKVKYSPEIIIGDNVIFNYDCHIGCINKIVIGNNVLIASRVFITDHFHGEINLNALNLPPFVRDLFSKGSVIIEDNVWIGEGVVILPNVRIGKNSIIGANSVVNRDIPANSVAGGIPSRILKQF